MRAERFLANDPRLETIWRAIILYGDNSATFKCALAKSLLELLPESGQHIRLDELAEPYSRNLVEHLRKVNKQGTNSKSTFRDACRHFNTGELTHKELIEITVKRGFQNVLEAFHNVDSKTLPRCCDLKKPTNIREGIVVSDNCSMLLETTQCGSLGEETETRWRLVEAAWEMNISRNLLSIEYDTDTKYRFGNAGKHRHVSLASCRSALNNYQKGKCLYCACAISLSEPELNPHGDHFFPWKLGKEEEFQADVDGVWTLVLACQDCNIRKGKRLPTPGLQNQLLTRNDFLIQSHHPLRETLIKQYGSEDCKQIEGFHVARWNEARNLGFIVEWDA